MKDKELIDMLLRLEARITQLENHYHLYNAYPGRLGPTTEGVTSKPKIAVKEEA